MIEIENLSDADFETLRNQPKKSKAELKLMLWRRHTLMSVKKEKFLRENELWRRR